MPDSFLIQNYRLRHEGWRSACGGRGRPVLILAIGRLVTHPHALVTVVMLAPVISDLGVLALNLKGSLQSGLVVCIFELPVTVLALLLSGAICT